MKSNRESQNKRLLKHLISGESITPLAALKMFGIMRLAARIKNLKEAGIIIQDKMHFAGSVKFKQYWIDKKTCDQYRKLKAA